jgi:hypothetical protein
MEHGHFYQNINVNSRDAKPNSLTRSLCFSSLITFIVRENYKDDKKFLNMLKISSCASIRLEIKYTTKIDTRGGNFMKRNLILLSIGAIALIALLASCVSGPGPAVNKGPVLAFQTFEGGSGFSAGVNSTADLDKSGATAKSTQCVKFSFQGTGDPGDSSQCVNVQSMDGKPVDATQFKFLIFYIKDTQGANTHKVTLVDETGGVWNGWVDVKSKKDNWVKITMPLRQASGVDIAAIKEIRIGEWNAGTYYIDDLFFTVEKTDELQ